MDEQENLIKFGYTPKKMLLCAHFCVKGQNFV
jgi:hypothetical protein